MSIEFKKQPKRVDRKPPSATREAFVVLYALLALAALSYAVGFYLSAGR